MKVRSNFLNKCGLERQYINLVLPSQWVSEENLGVSTSCNLVLAYIKGARSWCLQKMHEVGA